MKSRFLAVLLLILCPGVAWAQSNVLLNYKGAQNQNIQVSPSNPLPIGTVSTNFIGFTPGSEGTPITVTTSSTTGNLPGGVTVVVSNVGLANTAYCSLGGTADTGAQPISPGGGWFAFTVGVATTISCITTTGTTVVNLVGGSGSPAGAPGSTGGGSSSGGASGTPTQTAVTVTSSSGTLVGAGVFANFLKICVALSAANGIWVDWSGNAAVQAPPSEFIGQGQCDSWSLSGGFLPTSQVNAIAVGSVAVSVIGN